MAKKKKSKFKKVLKTLGKVAALGGAAYGASKLFGGKQGTAFTNPIGGVDEIVRKKAARNKAIDAGVLANVHDSESDMYTPKKWWSFKHGGKVGVGIAKRGFGRALRGKK